LRIKFKYIISVLILNALISFSQEDSPVISKKDTSYTSIAPQRIVSMVKPGKAPKATLQLSFNYNIGHLDLADNENTQFRKADYEAGKNFGTRYGFGALLTGKFALHKEGNIRLNVTAGYNRFMSNFVISESPDGKVTYNVFTGGLGIENNFSPDKRFKPYVGLDIVTSLISGKALLKTDSTDYDLKIRNAVRFGVSLNLGVEIAFNNKVGMNLGYKITHANIIGRETKASTTPNETYLNDEKLSAGEEPIPFAGWRQFVYSSFYAGINFYFGMKYKK
jgi:opacity protein-like surface antigen